MSKDPCVPQAKYGKVPEKCIKNTFAAENILSKAAYIQYMRVLGFLA